MYRRHAPPREGPARGRLLRQCAGYRRQGGALALHVAGCRVALCAFAPLEPGHLTDAGCLQGGGGASREAALSGVSSMCPDWAAALLPLEGAPTGLAVLALPALQGGRPACGGDTLPVSTTMKAAHGHGTGLANAVAAWTGCAAYPMGEALYIPRARCGGQYPAHLRRAACGAPANHAPQKAPPQVPGGFLT